MKSKSLIALSILCLALGACATTDPVTEDPNVAQAEDHANQASIAARADDVSYSTLTPNTEQTTVTTTTTKPAWETSVENPPATDSTLVTQSGSTTTVTETTVDTTADTTATITTTTPTPDSMASSSTVDDDDDDTTSTTETETRTRLRKD